MWTVPHTLNKSNQNYYHKTSNFDVRPLQKMKIYLPCITREGAPLCLSIQHGAGCAGSCYAAIKCQLGS